MKTYGRVAVVAAPFYISTLDGGGLPVVQCIKSSVCGATAKNNINRSTGVYVIGMFVEAS
jgi:hypothetical protein